MTFFLNSFLLGIFLQSTSASMDRWQIIIQFVLSFLGGGIVVAILDWVRTARSERKARRIEYVRSQLQELYGPLQFFVSQNAKLFELTDGLHEALTQEYEQKQYREAQATQDRVRENVSQTIGVSNEYIGQVTRNNVHILKILESNYSLIEPADAEVFIRLIVDCTRLKIEHDEMGRLKIPVMVYKHLGAISFMRPEFIEVVDKRFAEKQAELQGLLK